MRQRIARQNVHAEFQHEHVRRKRVRQRHGDGIKGRQERLVVSFGGQRDVDVEAAPGAFADFIFKTAPREKRLAALVQRNRHHVLAAVKRRLHAVAVVRVHVQIQNPFAGVRQFHGRRAPRR